MGSAIGTGVARLLEANADVEAICGLDLEPPRRWLRRAEFHYVRPGDSPRIGEIVTDFSPTVFVHAWVFEPRARSSPGQARARTIGGTEAIYGALCRQQAPIERIVLRSALAIHGSTRAGTPIDVDSPVNPRTYFGQMLADVERRSAEVATSRGARFVPVRLASIMSSSLANPLGRFLRLPVVPVPVTTRRFGVVHLDDACAALAAAVTADYDGPVPVMADGPVTPLEALTIGRRAPLPMAPLGLRLARPVVEVLGRPLPEHVVELLERGQVCAPFDLAAAIGVSPTRTTRETIADMYASGQVIEPEIERVDA